MLLIILNGLDLVTHGLDPRGRKCSCCCSTNPVPCDLAAPLSPGPPGPGPSGTQHWCGCSLAPTSALGMRPLRFAVDTGSPWPVGRLLCDGHREVTADYKETLVKAQRPVRPEA